MARRVLLLFTLALLFVPGGTAEGKAGFREVAQLPLVDPPTASHRSGWLILNPTTRRGYQLFEGASSSGRTMIQSFDLDTLQPLRRVQLSGIPITAGPAVSEGATFAAAEVVHAVDQQHGRIYLAMSQAGLDTTVRTVPAFVAFPPDSRRPLARFVAIDEAALDRCGGEAGCPFAASFREPLEQERLHQYWVAGMTVTSASATPGRLLVLFAQPRSLLVNDPLPPDHTLAQWEPPTAADFAAGEENETAPVSGTSLTSELTVRRTPAAGLPRRLDTCRATLASSAAGAFGMGNYQWGLLATGDAVWTACQTAQDSGAVTRIAVDAAGNLDPVVEQFMFPMGQRISDVLVNVATSRLFVRTYGGATSLWVFETASRRFTGIVTVKNSDAYSAALGVHPVTGRLYALVQDHMSDRGIPRAAVQGGLQYSDPPGSLVNVLPDMAYPAGYRIQVDSVTDRFFVRRAHQFIATTPTYPGTEATTPAPPEPFYRVFEDKVKPAGS